MTLLDDKRTLRSAMLAWRGAPTGPQDPLWSATPESERAFLNTADYARARGLDD